MMKLSRKSFEAIMYDPTTRFIYRQFPFDDTEAFEEDHKVWKAHRKTNFKNGKFFKKISEGWKEKRRQTHITNDDYNAAH